MPRSSSPLIGLSLILSHFRARLRGREEGYFHRLLKRSAWILGLALEVSIVTYLFIGRGFIVFGVLHLIGISLLLGLSLSPAAKSEFHLAFLGNNSAGFASELASLDKFKTCGIH